MSKLIPFIVVSIFAIAGCNGQDSRTILKGSGVESGIKSNTQNPIGLLGEQISEYVREVFQDRDGVYWFGTNGDGVGRYDGESLTFLSVEEGFGGRAVRGILQAPDGELWFATEGGVSRYKDGKFTNFTKANGLTDNQVWSIYQDSTGTIWVGTMGGVCRFDGKTFVPFPIPRAHVENPADGFGPQVVWSMFEDRDGNMWFGTDGEGARKYDGTSFSIYTNKEGLAGNTVRSIVGDSRGRIWFGTRFGGVSCFDGTEFQNFTKADGLTNNEVYEILEDKVGNLWFSTRGEGVCRYDGKTFTAFGSKNGLTLPHVQSIFEDQSGILWFGCSGGLFRYDGKAFVNVRKDGPWPTGTPSAAESKVDEAALPLDGLKERSVYAALDKAAIEAIARAARTRWKQEFSGFTFEGVERCTAGGVTHWMSIWLHDKTGLEFVLLPGGKFQMGSPADEPSRRDDELQHWVTLDPFLIARTECTQEAWAKIVKSKTAKAAGLKGDQYNGSGQLPISGVGPVDVELWCQEANLSFPTEAQWEYMCRAGTTSPWTTGTDKTDLIRFANLGSLECPEQWIKMKGITEPWHDGYGAAPAEVGKFDCNAFPWRRRKRHCLLRSKNQRSVTCPG